MLMYVEMKRLKHCADARRDETVIVLMYVEMKRLKHCADARRDETVIVLCM